VTDGARDAALEPESSRPAFAHASEEELARILDFYEVRWEYEPHVFPILWNLEGAVLESFAPDFYLPDLDLYVELTTLKQSLVRKKNRKLRRLRELYPEVRIKLFYGRDFRALMLKYGKVGLIDELSGTSGQAAQGAQGEAAPDLPAPAIRDRETEISTQRSASGSGLPTPSPDARLRRRSALAHPATLGTRNARSSGSAPAGLQGPPGRPGPGGRPRTMKGR
jgi:hypothetical protein